MSGEGGSNDLHTYQTTRTDRGVFIFTGYSSSELKRRRGNNNFNKQYSDSEADVEALNDRMGMGRSRGQDHIVRLGSTDLLMFGDR